MNDIPCSWRLIERSSLHSLHTVSDTCVLRHLPLPQWQCQIPVARSPISLISAGHAEQGSGSGLQSGPSSKPGAIREQNCKAGVIGINGRTRMQPVPRAARGANRRSCGSRSLLRARLRRFAVFCNWRLRASTCFDIASSSFLASDPALATFWTFWSALPIAVPILTATRVSLFFWPFGCPPWKIRSS